jgi:hypothetical protein
MQAPKHLRKPQNWQDFEKLCLKLWGAIWNNPEGIESHSTNEQGQEGVDIFCWVDSEDGYVGIQCKNKKDEKNDGSENRITLAEIKKEIEKAESFEPKLKKYIIATTAEKDGVIQKEVRKTDAERRSQGKFSVEIKFWDYITSKIDEHKSVHNWYAKSQNFKQNEEVKITFADGTEELTLQPKFKQKIRTYYKNNFSPFNSDFLTNRSKVQRTKAQIIPSHIMGFINKVNRSFERFSLKIKNVGTEPIENWKIKIDIEGPFQELERTNIEGKILVVGFDTFFSKEQPHILIQPHTKILVGGDEYSPGEIFIKPEADKEYNIILNWKLLSNRFQDEGKLTLHLIPNVEIDKEEIATEDPRKLIIPNEIGEIEDFFEYDENK